MTLRLISWVLGACTAAIVASGCGGGRTERDDAAAEPNRTAASGDRVTIAGCLTSSEDGRAVLTAAPDQAVSTAARVGTGVRDTHTYVLVGGDNLQAHLGKRVEVIGTVAEKDAEFEHEASDETARRSTGRADDTARVSSTEEIDVEIRELSVSSVREIAPSCQLNP